jgi:N-acetylglucosaminyldiphosphoundecaprenol N-acetyl-beta-D-mannosaminyltransferase
MISKTDILGVGITNESKEKVLEEVIALIKKGEKFTIATPNPEILVYAKKHKPYQTLLNHAWIALPDGVGLLLAAKILGKPLNTRIAGVDFMENLCEFTAEKPLSMGFMGGEPGIAERAVECLREKYPWIRVAFVGKEWSESGFIRQVKSHQVINSSSFAKGFGGTQSSQDAKLEDVRHEELKTASPTIDILFVAFGAPKQEEWIAKHLEHIPVTAAMGVGGSFDYLSGNVARAPKLVRTAGFEWLFRLISQPWRWKRQIALLEFVYLVIKERVKAFIVSLNTT